MNDTPVTIREALDQASRVLQSLPGAAPRLEAEVLLSAVLGKPRSHLFAWPDRTPSPRQLHSFRELVARRTRGEPLAYLTGRREFWSLDLKVTPATLVPRPETERLVERALEQVPPEQPALIADLGTGSGAIAAAIASERPLATLVATDIDAAALAVAGENFRRLGLGNIRCRQGEWCDALPPGPHFDLIASNPPYVAEDDPHLQQQGLPWEPPVALTAGRDGLDALRRIARQAPKHLQPGGLLLLEHGHDQGAAVRGLLRSQGFRAIHTLLDLAGLERATEARWPGAGIPRSSVPE